MPAGAAAVPAVDADRLRIAEETGRLAVALIRSERRPSQIINDQAMENALRVLLAIGGSTNAVIHLAAIAGRLGLLFDLKKLNKLSETTPVIVNLKPTGLHYMEDLAAAGGIPAVMRELRNLLHLDCITVTGETIGERLAAWNTWVDRSVIHSIDDPILPDGGLTILFGSLAPGGAVIKRSAADPRLFEQEGRCIVFASLDDLASRIDDPSLDVAPDDFLVLKNAGPRSAAAMPEAGYLPIPKKLARMGVKDMVRISDARMSGTAFGTVVLHVTPDASSGGPLALVRTGDRIRLSVREHRLDLLVEEDELGRRRSALALEKSSARPYARGYSWLYDTFITQANEGCDFAFLRKAGGNNKA
jgi:dihydroxy-acid dehydratase